MDPVAIGSVTHNGKTRAAWYWPLHQGQQQERAVFIYELQWEFAKFKSRRKARKILSGRQVRIRVDTSCVVVVMLVQYVDIYTGCTTRVHTVDVSRVWNSGTAPLGWWKRAAGDKKLVWRRRREKNNLISRSGRSWPHN